VSEASRRLSHYAVLHQGRLRLWVRHRLRGDSDAEDIAQETWARAAPVLARGGIANVESYLMRVAANLIADRAREGRRRAEILVAGEPPVDAPAPEPDAEMQLIARDRIAKIAAIVECLPPRCREVFLLRKSEGLSSIAIAERLGIGRNMVDKHLRHALMTIATRLGEVEE
jgi:RNA polymerase sigma-70 factor (ECF subfamily)